MKKFQSRLLIVFIILSIVFESAWIPVHANDLSPQFEVQEEETVKEETEESAPEEGTVKEETEESTPEEDVVKEEAAETEPEEETVKEETGDSDSEETIEIEPEEAAVEEDVVEGEILEHEGCDKALEDEKQSAMEDVKSSFEQIVDRKPLMALIYLIDVYEVKQQPESNADTCGTLKSGETVYVQGVTIDPETYRIWYDVSFWQDETWNTGYVEDAYLAYSEEEWINWKNVTYREFLLQYAEDDDEMITWESDTDADIEAFPLAYREKLRSLRASYPNWTFVAMNTGLDFQSVVEEQMGERSLIQSTNFTREKGFVGSPSETEGGWYLATKEGISFYLNPLNALEGNRIFQFEQLTFNQSYHTEESLQIFLNGTFMKGNVPKDERSYAQVLYEIGKERSLSPFHLASRIKQEQGDGNSAMISGTYAGYEGYYNYFNIGANGKTTAEKLQKGLTYAKNNGWNTPYKSLVGGAASIGNGYILKGQDTVYLQKFNVGNRVYSHQYMQNIQAPTTESFTTYKMYDAAGSINNKFVFKIPVYHNLPGENEPSQALESISIAPEKVILRRKDTVESPIPLTEGEVAADSIDLQVNYQPENTTEDRHLVWKTSDPKVANVDTDGKVTAVGVGTAVITATADKASAKNKPVAYCEVTVAAPLCKVELESYTSTVQEDNIYRLLSGKEMILKEVLSPADTTTNAAAVWSSSNPEVATVNDGRVAAEQNGMTEITVNIADQTATIAVQVVGCEVIFWQEDGITPYKVMNDLRFGTELTAEEVPDYSGEVDEGIQFLGWYTEPDGKGMRLKTPIKVEQEKISFYPKFSKSDDDFYIIPIGDQVYTGSNIKPQITVYDANQYREEGIEVTPLIEGKDYAVSYSNVKAVTKAGKSLPTITIKGMGNYSGTKKVTFQIIPCSLETNEIHVKELMVEKNGKTIMGVPEVYRGTVKLKAGTDYTLSYPLKGQLGAYKDIGKYPIVITGKDGYCGTITAYENIIENEITPSVSIAKAKIEGVEEKVYTGYEKDARLDLTVSYQNEVLTESTDGITGDYIVTYQNTHRAGTASVTLTGINRFKGKVSKKYKIKKADIVTLQEQNRFSVLYEERLPYTKKTTSPTLNVKYTYLDNGREKTVTLKKGQDYTVSFKNNTTVTTESTLERKRPYFTLTGKGNFEGTLRFDYEIMPGNFADTEKITVSASDVVFANKANLYKKTKITVMDVNGKTLDAKRDYVISDYLYAADTEVMNKSDLILRKANTSIQNGDILFPGTVVKVILLAQGHYGVEGQEIYREATFRIIDVSVESAKVKILTKFDYQSGKPVCLTQEDLSVTYKNKPLLYGVDYVIDETSYSNNTQAGTATVVIKGIPSEKEPGKMFYFGGQKKIKYTIRKKAFLFFS